MGINYVKVTYEKNGKRLQKEFTSRTKSSSELRNEARAWERAHDIKVTCTTAGSRNN